MLSSMAHTSETLDTSASSQFSASEKPLSTKASFAQASSLLLNPMATSAGPMVNAFSTPAACSHSDSASSASDCSSVLIAGVLSQLPNACISRLCMHSS